MSNLEWFCVVGLGLVALAYLGSPLLILSTLKFRSPARILFVDPEKLQLPTDVAEFLEPAREQFVALGFRPVAYFCLPDFVANAKSISVMLINTETAEGAMINCIYGEVVGTPVLIQTKYVEFITRFRDGVCVMTNNSPEIGAFRGEPGDYTIQFWDVQDVVELYRRHQQISERLGTSPRLLRLVEEFGNDVEQYIQKAMLQDGLEYQVQIGLCRRVSDGYRPTLRGAFVFTWQLLWPWKSLRKQIRRQEAKRWLEEIGSA